MGLSGMLGNANSSLKDLNLYKKQSANNLPRQTAARIQFANNLNSDVADAELTGNRKHGKGQASAHAESQFAL